MPKVANLKQLASQDYLRKAKATLPTQEEGSYLSLLGGSFLSIVDSSDICMNLRVYIATCVALFFSKGAKYGKYYSISKEG